MSTNYQVLTIGYKDVGRTTITVPRYLWEAACRVVPEFELRAEVRSWYPITSYEAAEKLFAMCMAAAKQRDLFD